MIMLLDQHRKRVVCLVLSRKVGPFPPRSWEGVCAVEGVIFLSRFSAWQNFLVETSVYMCLLLLCNLYMMMRPGSRSVLLLSSEG